MKKSIFTLVAFALTMSLSAQTVFGKWENRDEDTGKVDSVIEVYENNGKAYAKIVDITNPERKDAVCDKCPSDDARKGKKLIGMDILTGLTKDGDEWNDGEILDPKKGKIYGCYIKLKGANKLKVKGHLKGMSFIGRTVYWYRKK